MGSRSATYATTLLERVNALLNELGVETASVTSGFRPTTINTKIVNAAKKSLHTTGKAVDILDDKDQTLGKLILSQPELLLKYGLWIEALESTTGKLSNWVRLDMGVRSERVVRTFKP